MLYNLLYPLHGYFSALNIFRYLTFRASLAAIVAFLVSIAFGPFMIRLLKRLQIGEKVVKGDSAWLDEAHRGKQGTPTMGGILILFAVVTATVLLADITNRYILLALLCTLWLGVTGFIDDYFKQKKRTKGLTAMTKFTSQVILGVVVGALLYADPFFSTQLDIPFLKDVTFDPGIFYILIAVLVITGASNAVNLTDGLDGLAIGCVIMAALAFSVLSYVTGNSKFAEYLLIPYIRGSGELTVFCSALFGAGLGFLWFNCHPASIFMGDVGSLALGGALGVVALLVKKELLLVIVGGIFVVEALSVIIQVASFKLFKKRVFKIAPLHHHFQKCNWAESKVIVRFWIVAIIMAILTLVTLKVR